MRKFFVNPIKFAAESTLMLVLVTLAFEAISFGTYFVLNKEIFSVSSAESRRNAVKHQLAKTDFAEVIQGNIKVLHPFLGYVYDASRHDYLHAGVAISEFGFSDDKSIVQKRANDTIIIGVLGGSVAWWFQELGRTAFLNELHKVPELRSRNIQIVRLALGGYRQPQQLMTYAYARALGAEFDVLINIDGFNEVALRQHGSPVSSFFPHEWEHLAANRIDPEQVKRIGLIQSLENARKRIADVFGRGLLPYSPTANVFWQFVDSECNKQIVDARRTHAESQPVSNLSFAITGPSANAKSSNEHFHEIANVWRDSSKSINALASADNTHYLHFLQPNQYVTGSRRQFTDEERKTAYSPGGLWSTAAADGYPYLIETGRELKEAGVSYTDLTQLFQDEPKAVYVDDCCHLSEKGNELLGEAVGKRVAEVLRLAMQ